MKFYSFAEPEKSLYQDALNFAGISDTSQFPLTEFTRSSNAWYRWGDSQIWQATGTWEFDDSNQTSLPISTGTLVASQQDYEIPSTARKIDRIEILDNNEDYRLLTPLDKSQVGKSMSEFYETDGLPRYYDLVGRSIMLYPAPAEADVTTTKGIKVYYSRDIDEFGITDTSTEPGFDNHFHRIISLGAAYDFCLANGITDRTNILRTEIEEFKKDLQEHYGSRHRDSLPKIIPTDKNQI
ncbi:MAG: hypothetical protein U9O65_07095 [Thermotogota bacterium]|nr:hypothetical protein [Thermotogota bacterium]